MLYQKEKRKNTQTKTTRGKITTIGQLQWISNLNVQINWQKFL
jgi:hypothetical protein